MQIRAVESSTTPDTMRRQEVCALIRGQVRSPAARNPQPWFSLSLPVSLAQLAILAAPQATDLDFGAVMRSRLKNLTPRGTANEATSPESTSSPQLSLRRLKDKMSQVWYPLHHFWQTRDERPTHMLPSTTLRHVLLQVSMRLKGKGQASGEPAVRRPMSAETRRSLPFTFLLLFPSSPPCYVLKYLDSSPMNVFPTGHSGKRGSLAPAGQCSLHISE